MEAKEKKKLNQKEQFSVDRGSRRMEICQRPNQRRIKSVAAAVQLEFGLV